MINFSWIKNVYFPQSLLDFLQSTMFTIGGIVFDVWLIPHFLVGILLGFITKKWQLVISIFILFELFENLVLYKQQLTIYEPLSNVFLDIIVAYLGYWLVWKFKN